MNTNAPMGAHALVAHGRARIAVFTAALVGVALAGPATAAHVVQSVALHSAGGSSAHATSFVRTEGKLYLAGSFSGEVDFNPNGAPRLYTSACPGTAGCSFVAKYSESMQLQWLDMFQATGDSADQRLVGRANGGVYLVLDFAADFAYRPNEMQPVYHADYTDIAVIALDAEGVFAGAAQLGADGWNVLRNSRPFEAAPGVVDFAWTHQSMPFAESAFYPLIGRVDTLTGNATLPSIAITAELGSFAEIRDQRPDASGRYVCGEYGGTVDFDALHAHRIVISDSLSFNAFIARYDTSGALAWLSTVPSTFWAECYGLAVDADGTLHVAGDFGGDGEVHTDADPLPVEISSTGFIDLLVLSYGGDGALTSHAFLGGGPGGQVYADRIEAAADGSLTITGIFRGSILHGFVDELTAETLSDQGDAFALVVGHDLTTQFFAHIGSNGLSTSEDTLQLARPMQIDTIARTQLGPGRDADLNYAYPPEQALLHNGSNFASAFVRYDLDALLVNGFDGAQR